MEINGRWRVTNAVRLLGGRLACRPFLSGTETRSIEIAGHLPMERANDLAGGLTPISVLDGRAEVNVLAFRMKGLAPAFHRWIGADYGEVLLRLGVVWRGAPAWLALHCFLDRANVASLGRRFIRYPTSVVSLIEITERNGAIYLYTAAISKGSGPSASPSPIGPARKEISVALESNEKPAAAPSAVRPMLVHQSGALYRVPWDETPAPKTWSVAPIVHDVSLIENQLGVRAEWTHALAHEGRTHHCGIATAV